MQWLLTLETENDPIPACRILNVFRRKGVKIETVTLAAQADGFTLMALIQTPEAFVDHLFNFLRRMEGIRHVTYYRHEPLADASFVFIDSVEDSSNAARFLQAFSDSRLIFASHGKYLFEVPAESRPLEFAADWSGTEALPFARVKTTRTASQAELVGSA